MTNENKKQTKKIPSWEELNRDNGPIGVAKKTTKDKETQTIEANVERIKDNEDLATVRTVANETQKEFNDAVSEWQTAKENLSMAWIKVVTAESKRNLADKKFSEAWHSQQ